MALLATSPDLLQDTWLAPTQLQHHALPEDIWSKFEMEQERAIAIATPEALVENISFSSEMGSFITTTTTTSSSSSSSSVRHAMGLLPTPPHSPPTEHDLDDLVASIPEILESPSATPPSDISDILSDLEGMEVKPLGSSSPLDNSWASACSWWPPVAAPVPQESLKRDIMWGGGTCCPSLLDPPPRKERQVSECSADAALREALRHDDISDDDDSEDNLPDTPSGTDSDCDADDHMSESSSSSGSPRSTNSASRYTSSSAVFRNHTSASYVPPSVNSEHNYCGRVPEPDSHAVAGIITPSDTEDEVDVVSCSDPADVTSSFASSSYSTASSSTFTSTISTTTRLQVPSKRSVYVKRQLQLVIQEARRNRQNRASGSTSSESDEAASSSSSSSNRFVSVKIKTQGKPAAYTKRMRDYHSEIIKSTKHRRRNRGESDEGRRNVHNSLERQRRVDLRNAFEYLRLLVPETKILEKAPKVQILKKAAEHCQYLQRIDKRQVRQKEELKKLNEELRQRISQFS